MVTFTYLALLLAETDLLSNWECEILCQSSPICFLHLFSKMGHRLMSSVCKEVRAPNPSGNDSNLGQPQISSVCKEVRAPIPSGNDPNLGQ